MKRILFIVIALISVTTINAQIIISNDTTVCGNYTDVLQALSADVSSMHIDDQHDSVPIPIGFTFDFYGTPYDYCAVSGNGYITFDTTQAAQYSPWNINTPIPNPGVVPENAIMAPWQDIHSGVTGNIYYGTTGIAPNRMFTVTWCSVAMFSCTSDLHTSQIVLYEGSNKIEMFIQDKPLCLTWNGGAAIQGLVDATSTNFDIVTDPLTGLPRNFPLPWTATNEGWEFVPNGTTSYTIDTITYVPIIAGANIWTDANGVVLGTGPSLPVNIMTSTTIYAEITGVCIFGALSDSIVINVIGCFSMTLNGNDASCLGTDASITCTPDLSLSSPPWNIQLLDMNSALVQNAPNVTNNSHTFNNLFPGSYIVKVTDVNGFSTQETIVVGQMQNPIQTTINSSNVNCYGGNDGRIAAHVYNAALPFSIYLDGVLNTNPIDSVFLNVPAGQHIITVIDDNNCMSRDTINTLVPASPLQLIT
ncbi:hypothetical protein OAJ65_03010, partial [Flavobacteriales bacterium]|nr:hypothetical protein [Flavobacteriales bacterium]